MPILAQLLTVTMFTPNFFTITFIKHAVNDLDLNLSILNNEHSQWSLLIHLYRPPCRHKHNNSQNNTRQNDRFRSHGLDCRHTAETETNSILTSERRLYWHTVLPVHWTLLMYTQIRILTRLSLSNRRHVVASNFKYSGFIRTFPHLLTIANILTSQRSVSPNLFVRGLLLCLKNNHGSSQPCHGHIKCPNDWYPKFKIYIPKPL